MQRPLFSDSAGSGRSSFGHANLGTRKKTRFLQILLICSFIAAGGIGVSLLTSARAAKNDSVYQQLGLFGDIFQRVRESYVDEVDDTDLIEAAIKGMLTSLDPHSSYLNADTFNAMKVQTQGRFGGLGIEITMENGMVKVVSPIMTRLRPKLVSSRKITSSQLMMNRSSACHCRMLLIVCAAKSDQK